MSRRVASASAANTLSALKVECIGTTIWLYERHVKRARGRAHASSRRGASWQRNRRVGIGYGRHRSDMMVPTEEVAGLRGVHDTAPSMSGRPARVAGQWRDRPRAEGG